MTESADFLSLTLEQLHVAARLLGLRCECFDPDTSPPTDWGPGEGRVPIPHHCECPFALFELPDRHRAPTSYAFFVEERDRLLAEMDVMPDATSEQEGFWRGYQDGINAAELCMLESLKTIR
jgi:hypothetical protein